MTQPDLSEQKLLAQTNQEIDFIEFLTQIILLFYKKIKWLLLFIIVGAGVGFLASQTFYKPSYSSEFVVKSRVLNKGEMTAIINAAQTLVVDGNFEALAKQSNQKPIVFQNLKSIELGFSQREESSIQDSSKNYISVIRLQVTNPQGLDSIQSGIISFIENNPYVKKRTEIFWKEQEIQLMRAKREEEDVEKAKKMILESLPKVAGTVQFSTGGVFAENLNIGDRIAGIQRQMEFKPDIRLLQKTFTPIHPSKRKQISTIAYTISFFFLLWAVWVVLASIGTYIQPRLKK
jgi:hypothetical protein